MASNTKFRTNKLQRPSFLELDAQEAFIDDDFELAVDLYSQAISLNPHNTADLLADRAQAYIKLNYFTEAVGDANEAIKLDQSTVKAYLRKGIACMKLEEYHTAKVALEHGAYLAKDDSRFADLITECYRRIEEEDALLDKSLIQNQQATTLPVETLMESDKSCKLSNYNDEAAKPKYRHDFYQKPDEVVLTIFAKSIPARYVDVQFGEQTLSVSINVPGETVYNFQPRLFGKIIQDKCRYQVLSTKIEIIISKAETVHWASLEYNSDVITVPQKVNVSSVGSNRPVYPTSKPRTTDWDKLEALAKQEEQEENLEGDASMNKWLKEVYLQGDEDSRRAMYKSYIESKGTVMSMDWETVGSEKVERKLRSP